MKQEYVEPPSKIAPVMVTREQAKAALDNLAWSLGQSAVLHLRAMYPEALKSVPKTAATSLRNHIRNKVNAELWPLIQQMIDAMNREQSQR